MKTIIVGWDSVSWNFVDPLLARDKLPNLKRIIDCGFRASLKSTIPPITPVAWATLITGKLPQRHGIYDWAWTEGQKQVSASSEILRGTPFWQRLQEKGIKVGLVNIPNTYPPIKIDGFVVCGLGAPGLPNVIASPSEVQNLILKEFSEYEPAITYETIKEYRQKGDFQGLFEAERTIQRTQIEIGLRAAEVCPVDVLIINCMLFDHINHWVPDEGCLSDALIEMDTQLGRLIDHTSAENVMVFSDHGARRIKGQFLIGEWLRSKGFVHNKVSIGQNEADLNFTLQKYLKNGYGIDGSIERGVRWFIRKSFEIWPSKMQEIMWNDIEHRVPRVFKHYWLQTAVDTQASVVHQVRNNGMIYLNPELKASEDSNYEEVVARLKVELASIRDPETLLPLFSSILSKTEAYGTDAEGMPPDLLVDTYYSQWTILFATGLLLRERSDWFALNEDNLTMGEVFWHGDHDHVGLLIGSGDKFLSNGQIEFCKLVDLPPTILHMHEVPVPKDYDGQVIMECMKEKKPVTFQGGDGKKGWRGKSGVGEDAIESDGIMKRLRALGYID